MHTGVVRVKFKPQLTTTLKSMSPSSVGGVLSTGISTFDAASAKVSASTMKRVFPYSAKHDAKHRKHGLHLWYEISIDATINPLQAVSAYSNSGDIEISEPVLKKRLITGEVKALAETSSEEGEYFNDSYLKDQWHYDNKGTLNPSVVEGDINLYEAWKTQAGQPNVIVSIVDGGIDIAHKDLKDNLWVNTAELNGEDGVDDDGNGFVDDVHGYNFVDNIGDVKPHEHGTHVAGTVAAVNNNGIGVAGVAGGTGNGDGVRLMSSQIFTSAGGGGGFASAIVYGADNGAVISQNSWGYRVPDMIEQVVLSAIDYFIEEAGQYEGSPMKGGIVIFASGNDNVDAAMYPGYYEKTLCVSALGPDNKKAEYSNYGDWVDISAPGGDQMHGQTSGVLSTMPNNSYGYMQGTSMACPHVSGIAALAVSQHAGPTFTADELRLYLESSTHDVDGYNPGFEGKMGVGYIDAAMVLKKNEGVTPDAVTDLQLVGIAQDFATLNWTVPVDEDDDYPTNFQIFYYTEEITNENLNEAQLVSINNTQTAGTVREFELTGLEPLTTYYFSIRSMDRWANKSELSVVVSGTTNAGPDINIDLSSIDLAISDADAFMKGAYFTIENLDQGLLKWEGLLRHKSQSLKWNSTGITYPLAKSSIDYSNFSLRKVRMHANDEAKKTTAETLTGYKEEIGYGDGVLYIIGESDTTYTNSSAVKYIVDQDGGFNLTNAEMTVAHDPATGNMVMEIYRGTELIKENLYYAQEVSNYNPDPHTQNVQLTEQIYFEKGETFWIVFHIPQGNTYCLGTQQETEAQHSDNCFMSFDMGASWKRLDSLIDDYYVWATKAISTNKYLGEFISLEPASGTVEADQTQHVRMDVDATKLINGSYQANLLIQSNDSDEKEYRLPVNITVDGQKPDLRNISVVDYGSVFQGTSKILIIPVTNFGYGNFYGVSASSNDPQFEIVKKPWNISARDYGYFTVKYTPDNAGNDNAIINLQDNKGNTHQVRLFGVGTTPAQIQLTPAEQVLPAMSIGETTSTSFTITNTGEYPLEYKIPVYDKENMSQEDYFTHKFGYSYDSNTEGNDDIKFVWEDITTGGEDVSDYFKNVHPNFKYKEVELGFAFPFYDRKITSINLTRFGVLTLDQEGPLGNCSPPNLDYRCAPKGMISAFGWPLDINRSGQIHYKKEAGKFIVQYTDVFMEEGYTYEVGTFQIVLFQNGNIEFRYKDVENMYSMDREQALIGLGDPEYQDGFLINGLGLDFVEEIMGRLQYNNTVFKVNHPGENLVKSLSKTTGIIGVGESEQIDVQLNTEGVNEGNLYQAISILSNDPFAPAKAFKVKVNVNGGGLAKPVINRTNIDFGQVFEGGSEKETISLVNEGNKDVEITSATLTGLNYIIEDANYPQVLKAKSTNFINVSLATQNLGLVNDILTVTCADGTVFDVALSGEVIAAPQIAVDVTSFDEVLEAGNKVVRTITVNNTGDSDLEFVMTGKNWLYHVEPKAVPNSIPDFSYSLTTNNDFGGPQFAWEELVGNGEKTSYKWYSANQQLWKPLALPFEFDLYNQPTDTLWISWQGMLTTAEPRINPPYIGAELFPNVTEPNSIVAPYFAIHNYPESTNENSGIFHKVYDDRVVIQWNECIDMYVLGENYSFQAILYKNGSIKYQYKAAEYNSWMHLGITGIENSDGTDGMLIAGYQTYLRDQLAILLTPGEKQVIPAKGTATFDIAIDATALNKGWYDAKLQLFNNTPNNSMLEIPVYLEVSGDPKMEAPADIQFGEVMAYEVADDWGWMEAHSYYHEFLIKNVGKDVMNFSSVALEDNSEAIVEYYVESWGMYSWQEVPPMFRPWAPFELNPGESQKMRIRLMPTGNVSEFSTNLVFKGNLPEGDYLLPIHATVTLPPVANLVGDEIHILANTKEHKENKSLVLSNEEGQGALEYSISIDYNRVAVSNAAEIFNAGLYSSEEYNIEQLANTSNNASPSSEEDYDTVMEYDTLTKPNMFIGYGEGQAFMPGIAFIAPNAGFKLSHIKTWYRPLDVLSSEVQVYVLAGGTGFEDAKLLTQESYTHVIEESDEAGGYITIELSEPQQFYPNEKFYIAISYPLGVSHPQGTVLLDEPVADRYFFPYGEGWTDVVDSPLENYAWMIKALEKEHVGTSWVSLTNETTGSIAAGESLSLDFYFNAAGVMDPDNFAKVIVESNDPIQPVIEKNFSLHLNQGPVFTIDTDVNYTVEENETISFKILVEDKEGDNCTYTLAEESDYVQMSVVNDTITITYSPGFEASGINSIVINGVDEHENATSQELLIEVLNVNRAPELIDTVGTREYYEDEEFDYINLLPLFSDPDNEPLNYVVSVDNPIVSIFTSDDEIAIRPLEPGSAVVTVVASDSEGLSAQTSFNVRIGTVTGIEDPEGTSETKVYPVPTSGPLNIVLSNSIQGDVTISVMNVVGHIQYQTKVNKISGEQIERLNIGHMPSGIYLVKITTTTGDIVKRVVKI
ncbi:S8 family serine peptidase [Ancylomarina sp.]|uniref:S8 family serine peptidase n=1 Tax=Ancylomarina sp. TaxID=1970196 RepID=UPI00356811A2